MSRSPTPGPVACLVLLLALPAAFAAPEAGPSEARPGVLAAAPAALPGLAEAAQMTAHAHAFRAAQGVAGHVAVAARAAGYDVAPVTLPATEDPADLMVEVAFAAHALQREALAGMDAEAWATVDAGARAAVRLLEPKRPGPDDDPAALESWLVHRPEEAPAVRAGLEALDAVDHARLWQATYLLASGVDRAVDLVRANGPPAEGRLVSTPLGDVLVAPPACMNDIYGGPFLYILDACGDDTYAGGAGGADASASGTGVSLAVVVDLAGNDKTYAGSGPLLPSGGTISPGYGAGVEGGISVVFDAAGDDEHGDYTGGYFAGAGYAAGIGVMVDAAGNDNYAAWGNIEPAKFGGGFFNGAGLLVDAGGQDDYHGNTYEEGAGWYRGVGILVELGGDDTYFDFSTFAQGSGGSEGLGLLVDVDGDDIYVTPSPLEQGAGGCGGVGVLVELEGNDYYRSAGWGQGFGGVHMCHGEYGELPGTALPAVGVLTDVRGCDTYIATLGPAQGSGLLGVGLLLETDGTDSYTAPANPAIDNAIRWDGTHGVAVDMNLKLGCEPWTCPWPTEGDFPDCWVVPCQEGAYGVAEPACVVPPPVECPPFTSGTFPDCRVGFTPCHEGVGVWPVCVTECPPPTTGTFPDCSHNPPPCPEDTVGVYPVCIHPINPTCPPPTTGSFPDCRFEPCPAGTVGVPPTCVPIEDNECPPPASGTIPNCSIVLPPCPPGYVGTWPVCVLDCRESCTFDPCTIVYGICEPIDPCWIHEWLCFVDPCNNVDLCSILPDPEECLKAPGPCIFEPGKRSRGLPAPTPSAWHAWRG